MAAFAGRSARATLSLPHLSLAQWRLGQTSFGIACGDNTLRVICGRIGRFRVWELGVDGRNIDLWPLRIGLGRVLQLISRVLIADDNALIRRQIRNILEMDKGLSICAEAENGLEAVEKARECWPDVCVMDVVMPVMDGLRATRAIKAADPGVRILIFAFDNSKQLEWESWQAGADAVLAKDQASSKLAAMVHGLAAA